MQWKASNFGWPIFNLSNNPCSLPVIAGAPSVVTETQLATDSPASGSFSAVTECSVDPVVPPSKPTRVNSSSTNLSPLKYRQIKVVQMLET